MSGTLATLTRRSFLIGSAAVAGGVVFGAWRYRQPHDNPLEATLTDGATALTPYVRIDTEGITLIAPRAEMGQGIHTTLAALVAEELDVSLEHVSVEHGPASDAYYNTAILSEGVPFRQTDHGWVAQTVRQSLSVPAKFLGLQVTGGSTSTLDAYDSLREAGAMARQALVEAAARRWGEQAADLTTNEGTVIAPDGKRLKYTDLAADAASVEFTRHPTLKPASQWRLLGHTQKRVDMPAKCTGTAQYSIDVRLPAMRYAAVRLNPYFARHALSFDASEAKHLRGVEAVLPIEGGFAVVASNTWYAFEGAKALEVEWARGRHPSSDEGLLEAVAASFADESRDSQFRDDGDVDAAMADTDLTMVDAAYRVPYLAHATLEPPNAVAHLQAHRLDIWIGTQAPTQVIKEAATLCGLPPRKIQCHTTMMGGGFGRRAEMDFAKQAVQVAMAVPGTPVKLTWTREDDIRHDIYRPMAMARLRGAVSDQQVRAMALKVSTQSVVESQLGRMGLSVPGPDVSIVQGAWDQPYAIPNYRVSGYRAPAMLPVGYWRSVGASQNGFFHECGLDELAHAAGLDPLELRLSLIDHAPSRRVLESVADLSSWGTPLPYGRGRGVAFVLSFGVPTAEVIEVSVDEAGVRIDKAFAVVDVGRALDPGNIEAQVQGGLIFGLSAAMSGEIVIDDGAVRQSNFHDYPCARMNQMPRDIEVRILENGRRLRGIGEPGTPPAAPALANAVFAATGRRIRELPLNRHVRFVART